MPRSPTAVALDLGQALAESYLTNDRMNQIVLQHLDPRAWRATPPGKRARTIAAIFSHVHNIRCKWLRLSAPHLKLPAPLHRARSTQAETRAALALSADRCYEMLGEALAQTGAVETFRRDGWAKPWPTGPAMLAYMITHDAHHRGQACMLAHQLGFPLPASCTYEIWAWEKLSKRGGLADPR